MIHHLTHHVIEINLNPKSRLKFQSQGELHITMRLLMSEKWEFKEI